MEINKDVTAVEDSIKYLVNTSESVGYMNGSIDELLSERANSSNLDDIEAYNSSIERMSLQLTTSKDNRAQAVENVKQAFEHYYS